jgi:hypothetical protein
MKTRFFAWLISGLVMAGICLAFNGAPKGAFAQAADATTAAEQERALAQAERERKRQEERLKREAECNSFWQTLSLEDKQEMIRLFNGLRELPREEAKLIRDGINAILRLSPAEREGVRENYRIWVNMTPEQRQKARDEYRRLKRDFERAWKRDHPQEEMPPFPFRLAESGKVIPPPAQHAKP